MLRQIAAILMFAWSAPLWAGSFDFLPAGSGPEKEFRDLMNAGNYRGALTVWPTSHERSAFGEGANGKAVYAYLLYQNGLPYLALDILLNQTQPRNLNPELLKRWMTEVKASALVQKGYLPTSGGWRSVVNNEPVKVRIKNRKDIAQAFAKAQRAPADQVNYKARIWWQIATLAPQINETDQALRATKLLRESGQTVIGQDQILSATARILYQRGELEAALNAFAQIPKSSTLWIESVEERAWAHLRRDDYDKSLSDSITLMSPALALLVGPESYFLTNLLALKACDYPRVFKTSELFKERHRARLGELQELAKSGASKNINSLLERFEQRGVSLEAAGPLVASLPRAAFRDQTFVKNMELRRQILAELNKAMDVRQFAGVLGESTLLAKVMGSAKVRADRSKNTAYARIRRLAADEVKEYRGILNKLHIVEAEVIQRLHVDDSLKGERSKLAKSEKAGPDVLVFPYNSDEVWLDELDNYKARVKDCPTLKGASL